MTKATATTAAEALSDLDRRALELAIKIDRQRNKACRLQLDDKLKTEAWIEVARFAAHRCQEISLHLAPRQCWPPSRVAVDDVDKPGYEHRGIGQSAALLRRMLAAGISRYHPDPIAALAAAPRRDAAAG